MSSWSNCKKILCIRADNMGDLIMTTPALRALKETFGCSITVLTSKMGSIITPFIPEIDRTIVHDLPWVKSETITDPESFLALVNTLAYEHFDAAIIFSVYSQNPLPAALLAFMAGIPKRLAYCRENPYHLLTDWAIEREPFEYIQHQVQRDLDLVKSVNAITGNTNLSISVKENALRDALKKLHEKYFSLNDEWIIFHPGVSEEKRKYPVHLWIQLGKLVAKRLKKKILITGSPSEKELAEKIQQGIGEEAYSIAGLFSLEEFIAIINEAPLVISVNTGTIHIAAATQTSVIALYALTNPQHTPWKVVSKIFPFPVEEKLKSNNVIINYVNKHFFNKTVPFPLPDNIFYAVGEMLQKDKKENHSELTEIISL